jgi:hypothetical protein
VKREKARALRWSVSHLTGANFQTDKLETIIIRFAKEEISYLTDISPEEDETYFRRKKIETEAREETLKKLFDMALAELGDFSTWRIIAGYSTGRSSHCKAQTQASKPRQSTLQNNLHSLHPRRAFSTLQSGRTCRK